jgi:predicted acylesterase/phospholipase RssA
LEPLSLKIGLAFSGGGFRAASFSLGVLTYLDKVAIGDKKLLEQVVALSTISGGTITGARYTAGIKKGESIAQIYHSLVRFMRDVDLVDGCLSNLIAKRNWDGHKINSLICAMADVYDKELFNGEKFGTLMDEYDEHPIHLKHFSFNATDFANALQFRFQQSERQGCIKSDTDRGIIGNYYIRIPYAIAKDIRLGDIMAASSCFPGGFEPINFPDDFHLPPSPELSAFMAHNNLPVGLMDGGIVDNQGIEPLLLADKRMVREMPSPTENSHAFDLLILSDVTSPFMDEYRASTQQHQSWWRRLTPQQLLLANSLILIGSLTGTIWSAVTGHIWPGIALSALTTASLLIFVVGLFVTSLPNKFQVPNAFTAPLRKLLKVKLVAYENMILNRSNSLLKMTNDVFLKHIRRLNYNRVYNDPSWKNRRIMNAIYELAKNHQRFQQKANTNTPDVRRLPSDKMRHVAQTAHSMGTTLWFTKEELEVKNMLNSIIACGQFTMCRNLLDYIDKLKADNENTSPNHSALIACEAQLLDHWDRLTANPFWLVEQYGIK